jgi:hypothetical protein
MGCLFTTCRYTRFIGNSSDWRQYSDPSYFSGTGGDASAVYAWVNNAASTGCNTLLPYICEYPSSMFPCFPPYVTCLLPSLRHVVAARSAAAAQASLIRALVLHVPA